MITTGRYRKLKDEIICWDAVRAGELSSLTWRIVGRVVAVVGGGSMRIVKCLTFSCGLESMLVAFTCIDSPCIILGISNSL